MRPDKVWQVARKEILSTLRDRRAIVSSLLIPLLILPFVMLGLPLALGSLFEREQSATTLAAVAGLDALPPELRAAIEAQAVELYASDDPETQVREGDAVVGLSVPPEFAAQVAAGAAELTLYSKRSNLRSELNVSKLEDAVSDYRDDLVSARLEAAGLDAGVLEPVTTTSVDASSEAERQSGQFAWLIPFFIGIWTLTGGQMTALDATAGEKERGTLEALLVSPVRRIEVVLGKFLATLTFGLSAALMAIIGYVLSGTLLRRALVPLLGEGGETMADLFGGSLSVTVPTVLTLIISALLLAGFVAAVLISVATFARSYKEAQTYVAPLSMVMIVPVIGLQFADFIGGNVLIYLVPLLNVLLLMNDVVKGNAAPLAVLLTWGSLAAFTGLLLDLAYRTFKREGVIFRT